MHACSVVSLGTHVTSGCHSVSYLRELALHCRRRTSGVEETARLIGALIHQLNTANGKDTLRVPLLYHKSIEQIWNEQQNHLLCIEESKNFPLYMKTGTLKKGGMELCCYRCARGSTSLESFHLRLNHFMLVTVHRTSGFLTLHFLSYGSYFVNRDL